MATFRKQTFYTMRRLDNGDIGAIKEDGFTDGEFYYYNGKDGWYCIDPDTGLSLLTGAVANRKLAYEEGHKNSKRLEDYKNSKKYQQQLLAFYHAKVKCGAYVFL